MLTASKRLEFELSLCLDYKEAKKSIQDSYYDIFLITNCPKYDEADEAVELIKYSIDIKCQTPVILLCDRENESVELEFLSTIICEIINIKTLNADKLEYSLRICMERKLADIERERLLKIISNKNDELYNIIYTVSHDLRTPLINIQGYSSEFDYAIDLILKILKEDDINTNKINKISQIRENNISVSLKYIKVSIQNIEKILNGLLRLSRLDENSIEIKTVSIDEVIQTCINNLQYLLNENNVKIEIQDKFPDCLGDEVQIGEIFSNLISNAIKYKNSNKRCIIKITGKKNRNNSIFCVEDNGIGISKDKVKKVFDIFYRVQDNEDKSGDGLGLSIVRRILDIHNGDIWVESLPGKGSKFYIMLPCEE